MNNILNYFKGVWSELSKVSWPTRREVINHTVIVIIAIIVAVLITAGIDFGLTKLVEFIIRNKS